MGRLIDADAFYKRYCEMYEDGVDEGEIDRVAYMLSTEPTAYDAEKVVAELERNRSVFEKQNVLPLVNMDYAVKVVKRGGVE